MSSRVLSFALIFTYFILLQAHVGIHYSQLIKTLEPPPLPPQWLPVRYWVVFYSNTWREKRGSAGVGSENVICVKYERVHDPEKVLRIKPSHLCPYTLPPAAERRINQAPGLKLGSHAVCGKSGGKSGRKLRGRPGSPRLMKPMPLPRRKLEGADPGPTRSTCPDLIRRAIDERRPGFRETFLWRLRAWQTFLWFVHLY